MAHITVAVAQAKDLDWNQELQRLEKLQEDVLVSRPTILGDSNPDTLSAKARLESYKKRVLAMRRATLGKQHPDT